MRLAEIITENQGDIYFDEWGEVYFRTPEALARAENSDWDKLRLAAKDFRKRDPQVGKNFAPDWNALPQGDRNNSELTTANTDFNTILDPNRAGLSTATLGKPEPIDVGTAVAGAEVDPKPTMPMGGIAGVIRRKKQK